MFSVPFYAQVALAVLGLLATVALSVYLFIRRPLAQQTTWGVGEIVAVSLLVELTVELVSFAMDLVGYEVPLSAISLSLTTLGQNVLLVALSVYVVSIRHRLPLSRLGLRRDKWIRLAALGVAAGVLATPLAIVTERAAEFLLSLGIGKAAVAMQTEKEVLFDPIRLFLQVVADPRSVFWLFLLIGIIVPIGEEVFFRGFVYGGLRARWGVTVALIVSGLFFAVVHVQLVHGLPIFVLGLLLAALYERTQSLVAPIVTHALYNILFILSVWRGWDS
jgi:membrane protease YdiL (CAAX protease family)